MVVVIPGVVAVDDVLLPHRLLQLYKQIIKNLGLSPFAQPSKQTSIQSEPSSISWPENTSTTIDTTTEAPLNNFGPLNFLFWNFDTLDNSF